MAGKVWITGILGLALSLAGATSVSAQSFEIESARPGATGADLSVRLVELPAETEVEIRVQRNVKSYFRRGAPVLTYQSAATFRADEEGRIDVASSPAVGGSYEGVAPRGLFWSMQPVSDDAIDPDNRIRFEALIDGRIVASATHAVARRPASFEIFEVPSLPGSYFAPHPAPGNHPVIILVDGADNLGVSREITMPRLVAEGFSVMHFATYSLVYGDFEPAVSGLPTRYVDIPIDRLQQARDWLAEQAGVDTDRIGLYGYSRNGAYVLLAATRFDWVRAVAGISPSDVVWEGWGDQVSLGTTSSYTWQGQPLPYVPYSESYFEETAKLARRQPARLRTPMDEGRWANPDRVVAARIPVETFHGALFLAGGEQDNIWSAGHMVQNIAERRAEYGLETRFLVLPDAGHNIVSNGLDPARLFEEGAARGIEAQGQYETWTATVDFFRQTLRPDG